MRHGQTLGRGPVCRALSRLLLSLQTADVSELTDQIVALPILLCRHHGTVLWNIQLIRRYFEEAPVVVKVY